MGIERKGGRLWAVLVPPFFYSIERIKSGASTALICPRSSLDVLRPHTNRQEQHEFA